MQSTNFRHIKAALWDQAFVGNARVSCAFGPVVAVRSRKGQLLAMIRGWGKWYALDSVRIELCWLLRTSVREFSGLLTMEQASLPKMRRYGYNH